MALTFWQVVGAVFVCDIIQVLVVFGLKVIILAIDTYTNPYGEQK